MQFTDTVKLGDRRSTGDGYLVVSAKIARTGIQIYSGDELGKPGLGDVRVYRPEDEVFADTAMTSFAHRPVTVEHPRQMVTAANWKDHAVGMIGDKVVRDGEFIQVAFTLMDQAAIDAVDKGKRELSCGYVCNLDWTAGTTDAGEPYDAIQRGIRGNHLAVVDRGRAGSSCSIGDAWTSTSTPTSERPGMPDNLRTVMVDGISISATDQSAQAIDKLQRSLSDASATLGAKDAEIATLKDGHAKALNSKDGVIDALKASHATALSAKDGEIDALKAKMPDAVALDAMIVDRERVIGIARKMLGDSFDPKGKSNADIRRGAVVKQMGDAAKDRDDAYIEAAFDALSTSVKPAPSRDPLRDALLNGPTSLDDAESRANAAHAKRINSLRDAWKGDAA